MSNHTEIIHSVYGNKIRVRASGVLVKDNAILLVKHKGIGNTHYFWAPPGGGVEFGESIENTIIREFKEECTISVKVREFLTLSEFVQPPLHAIELFYRVEHLSGTPSLGDDPELNEQALFDIQFIPRKRILAPESDESFHQVCKEFIL